MKNIPKISVMLLLLAASSFGQSVDEFLSKGRKAEDSNARIFIYTRAIKKHPDVAKLYHERGVAYGIIDYHEKALKDFSKAIQLDGNYAIAYKNRALAYHRLKKYDESARDCEKYIEMEPGDSYGHYLLGINYANLKKLPEAEIELNKAVEMEPSYNDNASVRKVRYLIKREKKKHPEKFIKKPDSPPEKGKSESPTVRGVLNRATGEHDGTVYYRKPKSIKTKILLNKARSKMIRKKYTQALELYEKALKMEPDVSSIYADKAFAEYKSGKTSEGLSALKETLAMDPGCAKPYVYLAVIHAERGEIEEAQANLRKAVRTDKRIKHNFEYHTAKTAIRKAKARK